MTRPEAMTRAVYDLLAKLPDERRQRIMERAAIYHYDAGLPWPDADEKALADDGIPTQRALEVG